MKYLSNKHLYGKRYITVDNLINNICGRQTIWTINHGPFLSKAKISDTNGINSPKKRIFKFCSDYRLETKAVRYLCYLTFKEPTSIITPRPYFVLIFDQKRLDLQMFIFKLRNGTSSIVIARMS